VNGYLSLLLLGNFIKGSLSSAWEYITALIK